MTPFLGSCTPAEVSIAEEVVHEASVAEQAIEDDLDEHPVYRVPIEPKQVQTTPQKPQVATQKPLACNIPHIKKKESSTHDRRPVCNARQYPKRYKTPSRNTFDY